MRNISLELISKLIQKNQTALYQMDAHTLSRLNQAA